MDGNGRWARQRGQVRTAGHRAGVRAARRTLRCAYRLGVEYLTVFAFSQENWRRPQQEVSMLMQLFVRTLSREIEALNRNSVRMRFIGDHRDFAAPLREEMRRAAELTRHNRGLKLNVAVGYGGQWEIVSAARKLVERGEAPYGIVYATDARIARVRVGPSATMSSKNVSWHPMPSAMIRRKRRCRSAIESWNR